jgi:hypothetical protein
MTPTAAEVREADAHQRLDRLRKHGIRAAAAVLRFAGVLPYDRVSHQEALAERGAVLGNPALDRHLAEIDRLRPSEKSAIAAIVHEEAASDPASTFTADATAALDPAGTRLASRPTHYKPLQRTK